MFRERFVVGLKVFSPILLFFISIRIAELGLKKYTLVGPIDHHSGQPIFSNFPIFVNYLFLGFMAFAFVTSILQLRKVRGWAKYACLLLILASLPLQYAFVVALQVSLFGK